VPAHVQPARFSRIAVRDRIYTACTRKCMAGNECVIDPHPLYICGVSVTQCSRQLPFNRYLICLRSESEPVASTYWSRSFSFSALAVFIAPCSRRAPTKHPRSSSALEDVQNEGGADPLSLQPPHLRYSFPSTIFHVFLSTSEPCLRK
jgi:hypothetical protein